MAKRPKRFGGGEHEERDALRGSRHGGHGAYRRASEADAWELEQQQLEDENLEGQDLSGLDRVDEDRLEDRNPRR